jgi:hypothetical protein
VTESIGSKGMCARECAYRQGPAEGMIASVQSSTSEVQVGETDLFEEFGLFEFGFLSRGRSLRVSHTLFVAQQWPDWDGQRGGVRAMVEGGRG